MSTNQTEVERCMFVLLDRAAVEEAYFSYLVNIAINSLLAPPTVLLNLVVIIAIWRTTSLHTPSNILICSLALSDLLLGLITQPFYVAYKFSEINGQYAEYCNFGVQVIALVSSYFLAGVSFLVLTALSVDRCLALHLGLRYRQTVTQPRAIKMLAVLWVFAAFIGSLQIYISLGIFFKIIAAIMLVCLVAMSVAYCKAYVALKRHSTKLVNAHNNSSASKLGNIAKYGKSLNALKFLLALILLCYVPHTCVYVAIVTKGLNAATRAAKNIVNPIVFANSLLNPIVYCWKIREIRLACRLTVRKMFGIERSMRYGTSKDTGTELVSLSSREGHGGKIRDKNEKVDTVRVIC